MNKEIELTIDPTPATTIETQPDMASAMLEIAKRTDIDPDKLEKLLNIQIKMEDRQNKAAYQDAMAGFQGDCPIIKRTGKVKFTAASGKETKYDFAPLDEIAFIIKPLLVKWGLSYSFNIKPHAEKEHKLITIIQHKQGHTKEYDYYFNPVHDDTRMNMSQRTKSAVSYAKRAAIENALGIVTAGEDTDARRALDQMITEEQINKIDILRQSTETSIDKLLLFLHVRKITDLSFTEAEGAIRNLKHKRSLVVKKKDPSKL